MAQITTKDGATLISTMWPSGLPKYSKGCADIASLHAEGLLVPTHEDAMRAWCFVAVNTNTHDRGRNKVLAHCNSSDGELREVAIRFQGFVKHAALGIYGTWDGKRENAAKAIQAITIGGGVDCKTFAMQIDAANNIRRYIVEELHGQCNTGKNNVTQLEFAHSVFTKVTPLSPSEYQAPSDFSTNLAQQANKVRHEWQVGPGVRIGVQEQNMVRAASGREIRRGDFVDVTALLNIRQSRRFNTTHTYVVLNPVRVVRLATASFVKDVCKVTEPDDEVEEKMCTVPDSHVKHTKRKIISVDMDL